MNHTLKPFNYDRNFLCVYKSAKRFQKMHLFWMSLKSHSSILYCTGIFYQAIYKSQFIHEWDSDSKHPLNWEKTISITYHITITYHYYISSIILFFYFFFWKTFFQWAFFYIFIYVWKFYLYFCSPAVKMKNKVAFPKYCLRFKDCKLPLVSNQKPWECSIWACELGKLNHEAEGFKKAQVSITLWFSDSCHSVR